jgi:N-acetylneuraminate synthase
MSRLPTFIIAEAGVNHDGSLKQALELVEVAAASGADAVKFQSFTASSSIRKAAKKAKYQAIQTNDEESQYDMSKRLELDYHAHQKISDFCTKKGVLFLSSPFDIESAKMLLHEFKLPLIKIPSGEITNAPLLFYLAQTHTSVILSTGMSTMGEVELALGVLAAGYMKESKPSISAFKEAYRSAEGQNWLKQKVTLLHCVSEYPTPPEHVHLLMMDTMKETFDLPVGLSDHTLGRTIAIAAAARGACVIEKHFTLDPNLPGPDHKASLSPDELALMVADIRTVEKAFGHPEKTVSLEEEENKQVVRKSLVALEAINKGEVFSLKNVGCKRPGTGISALHFFDVLGRIAERNYEEDEEITLH